MVDVLRPGDTLGQYRIERLLSRSTTEKYAAISHATGARVVIKCLDLARGGRATPDDATFRRELRRLTAIKDSRFPAVLDGDSQGGVRWIAEEFVEGTATELRKDKLPLYTYAVATVFSIANALQSALSEHGVLHGDLRLESVLAGTTNVRVLGIGCAALFGVARGALTSTPLYRAPEQLEGLGALDVRADIYSAGMLLYALLAGRPPFATLSGAMPSVDEALVMAERGGALLTPLPVLRGNDAEDAWQVIQQATARDPGQRYGSWEVFSTDLVMIATNVLERDPEERKIANAVLVNAGEAPFESRRRQPASHEAKNTTREKGAKKARAPHIRVVSDVPDAGAAGEPEELARDTLKAPPPEEMELGGSSETSETSSAARITRASAPPEGPAMSGGNEADGVNAPAQGAHKVPPSPGTHIVRRRGRRQTSRRLTDLMIAAAVLVSAALLLMTNKCRYNGGDGSKPAPRHVEVAPPVPALPQRDPEPQNPPESRASAIDLTKQEEVSMRAPPQQPAPRRLSTASNQRLLPTFFIPAREQESEN